VGKTPSLAVFFRENLRLARIFGPSKAFLFGFQLSRLNDQFQRIASGRPLGYCKDLGYPQRQRKERPLPKDALSNSPPPRTALHYRLPANRSRGTGKTSELSVSVTAIPAVKKKRPEALDRPAQNVRGSLLYVAACDDGRTGHSGISG